MDGTVGLERGGMEQVKRGEERIEDGIRRREKRREEFCPPTVKELPPPGPDATPQSRYTAHYTVCPRRYS